MCLGEPTATSSTGGRPGTAMFPPVALAGRRRCGAAAAATATTTATVCTLGRSRCLGATRSEERTTTTTTTGRTIGRQQPRCARNNGLTRNAPSTTNALHRLPATLLRVHGTTSCVAISARLPLQRGNTAGRAKSRPRSLSLAAVPQRSGRDVGQRTARGSRQRGAMRRQLGGGVGKVGCHSGGNDDGRRHGGEGWR